VSAALNDLEIFWDDHSHKQIFDMVHAGPGASLTETMEKHLKNVAVVLEELSNSVNRVIQRTGEEWQGSAADGATSAMWVLRGVDDGMYFTAKLADIRAFGQSDSAECGGLCRLPWRSSRRCRPVG